MEDLAAPYSSWHIVTPIVRFIGIWMELTWARTQKRHHLALNPEEGKHTFVLVDENGESLEGHFEVISSM